MTATLNHAARADVLNTRLAALYIEREQILAEIAPAGSGDDADRATNVDGHVRLGMLEQRIVSIEAELAEPNRARTREADGTAAVGDIVTVDLGDGPEKFLLGSIEQAGEDLDVISPSSPLGKVLQGASVGTTLSYSARPGRKLQATVIALD
jgi:transcription elongation factor GreA